MNLLIRNIEIIQIKKSSLIWYFMFFISCTTTLCQEQAIESFSYSIEQEDQINNYLFDVASYLLNTLGKQLTVGTTIPESPLAPNGWPKALLFDEPRGEPEELSCFHIGSQHVDLFWLIPIYGSEHELIKEKGLDAFDKLDETEDISLVDINRPPLATN